MGDCTRVREVMDAYTCVHASERSSGVRIERQEEEVSLVVRSRSRV